jgi:hypothetical protein
MPPNTQTELSTGAIAASGFTVTKTSDGLAVIDPPAATPVPAGDGDRPPPSDPETPPSDAPNAPAVDAKTAPASAAANGGGAAEPPKDGETRLVRPMIPVLPMGFEPTNWDEMWRFARWLANTVFVPEVVRGSPNDVMYMLMAGKQMGLNIMQSAALYVIEGKVCVPAQTQLALVRRSQFCKWIKPVVTTDEIATWRTLRLGESEPTEMSYTHAAAKRMGFCDKGKNPARNQWNTQEDVMLLWRACTKTMRFNYSDITGGFYDPDELRDAIEARGEEVVIMPLTRTTVENAKDGTPMAGAAPLALAADTGAIPADMREAFERSTEAPRRPEPEPVPAKRGTVSRVAERAAEARAKDQKDPLCPGCGGPVEKPGTCDHCKKS